MGGGGCNASAWGSTSSTGSRRRRLWELDSHAHCPVVGVCMPIAALRRLVDKVLDGKAVAEAAVRARQAGVPAYAIAGSSDLDLLEQRALGLQTIRTATTREALEAAAEELAPLL